MDNITNQTPSISQTTYNVASDATPSIDPLSGNDTHGHTEFTSTDTVGEIPGTKHPVYKAGRVVNNVMSFFERPNVIKQGVIPNASYGLISGTSTIPFTATSINASYLGNLSGSVGIRFTMCLKLEISATPQAAGIFKIGVLPFTNDTLLVSPIGIPPYYATLPSAEINLADTSSVVLKYPFNWDTDFLPITSTNPYCTIGVVAYTPFAADLNAGLSSTYTVYQWFEDVELVGPGVPFNSAVTPQMGNGQEFKVAGPVSKVMSYATKITSSIGSAIPPLSAYTRPLGWVFSGIGTLASHFGWSKPNDSNSTYMSATVGSGINCVTGVGVANELGMYANNEVKCEPFFASKDFDEMSICYLTCIPCPIATILLNGATDVYGTNKWVCQVMPSNCYYQGRGNYAQANMGGKTTGAVVPSTFMGVSQYFSGWRGDLVYRFKFARSKFMGGKVLIGYNPMPDTPLSQAPLPARRYDYQTVLVDLRTTTVADLEVPFTYFTDFAPTNFLRDSTGAYTSRNTGSVFMYVIEPLVSSGATTTQCYVEVEVFSKCGIQFANTIVSPLGLAPVSAPLVAQMGAADDTDVLERTCGEAIMSLKQLAMRPSWGTISNVQNFADDQWNVPKVALNTLVLPAMNWTGEAGNLNNITSWYKFYRGSILHHVMPFDSNTSSIMRWSGPDNILGGGPISVETRIANTVRRPFYSYHNRVLIGSPTPSAPVDSRKFTLQVLPNTTGSAYYSVTAGDDFQLGCFVYIPPLVSIQILSSNSP